MVLEPRTLHIQTFGEVAVVTFTSTLQDRPGFVNRRTLALGSVEGAWKIAGVGSRFGRDSPPTSQVTETKSFKQ
jgi:hypothetical protein